jgi:hypothetical protein
LPFTLKSHVKAKERRKIYGNSNISPLQKNIIIFKRKSSKKKPKNP